MMNKRNGVLIIALVLVAACAKDAPPRGTAIIDVTVIDAINGVREHQTVVFDGDEIISSWAGVDGREEHRGAHRLSAWTAAFRKG